MGDRLQQYHDAVRHLAKALELEPGLPGAQSRLRQIRQAMEQDDLKSK
jgi:hypothetical protein